MTPGVITRGPIPFPKMNAVAITPPAEFVSSTAPLRSPGAIGLKTTFTVQLPPLVGLVHVLPLPNWKSRFGVPWVSTSGAPRVPPLPRLNVTAVCAVAVPTATLPRAVAAAGGVAVCAQIEMELKASTITIAVPSLATNVNPCEPKTPNTGEMNRASKRDRSGLEESGYP